MKKRAFFILAISTFIFVACNSAEENSNDFINSIREYQDATSYTITPHSLEEENIFISFPQVQMDDNALQDKVNNLIIEEKLKIFNYFYDVDYLNAFHVLFQTNMRSDRLLSITYIGFASFGHPRPISTSTNLFFTTNINMQTGERVTLDDIVDIDDNFIQLMLSASSTQPALHPQLAEYLYDLISDDGFLSKLQNSENIDSAQPSVSVYFTDNRLGINFGGLHRVMGGHAQIEICYNALVNPRISPYCQCGDSFREMAEEITLRILRSKNFELFVTEKNNSRQRK